MIRDKMLHIMGKKKRYCKQGEEFEQCIMKREEELKKYYKRHFREFQRIHRTLKYFRPLVLVFNAVFFYFLFTWVGIKSIGIIFASLLILKEIGQFVFLRHLEKRILDPIDKLKNGVEEIAKGNYDVKVECNVRNEIGVLITSFNDMAQKLSESEKMKAEYEENRKTLIANISHDLKTPMTSIQGYIEAMLEGGAMSSENVSKYLQIISRNTAYMNKLIDDLFLFSKLDMHKLDFQFEVLPVKGFMNDLMEEFQFEMEEKHVNFVYMDKTERDFDVHIDRKRLHQAFNNILGNAVKYGDAGRLAIRVEMVSTGEVLSIGISDNGPGIPEDKLPFIFNRFYRIDQERTKDLMSTGLGLAIAKELIEAHKGSIEVSSTVGQGTCFTITLPAIK